MNMYKKEEAFSKWVLGNDSISESLNSTETSKLIKYVVASAQTHTALNALTHKDTGSIGAVLYSLLLSLSLSSNQPLSEMQAHLYRKDTHDDCKSVMIILDQYTKCLDDMIRLINDVDIAIDEHMLCTRMRIDNMIGDSNVDLYADIYMDVSGINIEARYNPNELSLTFIAGIIETARFFLSSIINNSQITMSTFIAQINQKTLPIYEMINQSGMQEKKDHRCLFELLSTYSISEQRAISFGDYTVTYAELFKKASQFANFLIENKICKGSIVGLMMERRIDWFYCVLGIMQIGAVCLPLNINQPVERLNKIITDSNMDCIIISKRCHQQIQGLKAVYFLDDINLEKYNGIGSYEKCSPEDDTYIIYTSGSSGQPKGIKLNHRGIINHINTKINILNLTQNDRFVHNFNFEFVASIWLIFTPIILGAEIILYDEKICNDPVTLFSHAAQDNVTVLEVVPWSFTVFLKYVKSKNSTVKLGNMRHIILTGEKVNPHIVNDFHKLYDQNLFNAYGQSECSDDTMHYLFDPNIKYNSSIIGRPSLNTKIYIFGTYMDLKLPGHAGIL